MDIDIEGPTEDELIQLNNRVVARLRFLREANAHFAMLDFKMGERVKFDAPGRGSITGTLIRYNRKSVTVLTEAGERWTVAPSFLRPADPSHEK